MDSPDAADEWPKSPGQRPYAFRVTAMIAMSSVNFVPWVGYAAYALLALFWLVPSQRIERAAGEEQQDVQG